MPILVTVVLLVGGLALFMTLIWSMLAVNARIVATRAYAPFALPNAALLLIAQLLALSALSGGLSVWVGALAAGDPAVLVKTGLAVLIVAGMLMLLVLRSGVLAGLYATLVMAVLSPVVLFSLLFWQLARIGPSAGNDRSEPRNP
jgi:hypothetical protein